MVSSQAPCIVSHAFSGSRNTQVWTGPFLIQKAYVLYYKKKKYCAFSYAGLSTFWQIFFFLSQYHF